MGAARSRAFAHPTRSSLLVDFAAWGGIHITTAGADFKEYLSARLRRHQLAVLLAQ